MEHLQAVQARIATIRGLVESARPAGARPGAFQHALDAALDTALDTGSGTTEAAPGSASGVPAAAPGEVSALLAKGMAHPPGLRAPVAARVSSQFGPRVHPVTGKQQDHSGVDFAAPAGTPVRAAAAGRVEFAGVRGAYGNLVIVGHADGTQTWYAHQRDLAVRAGQQVDAGAVLGTVGSTGRSTGPHLHLEVRRDGVPVDPLPLLGRAGVPDRSHAHG